LLESVGYGVRLERVEGEGAGEEEAFKETRVVELDPGVSAEEGEPTERGAVETQLPTEHPKFSLKRRNAGESKREKLERVAAGIPGVKVGVGEE